MSLLNKNAQQQLDNLLEKIDLSFLSEKQQRQLKDVMTLSDFIRDALFNQPELIKELFDSGVLKRSRRCEQIRDDLQNALSVVKDEQCLHQLLRQFRCKQMVIIAWRELLGEANIEESFIHLSYLADQIILQTMNWLYEKQSVVQGIPRSAKGVQQSLYVFAMGKLGGEELNFSSDIDLIFAYPEGGETKGGRKKVDNHRFFTKLAQRLIAALHQITVDGFVFRVDMRLRPFGDSGPLVCNFTSLEDYYQSHGREWERYALIKARVLGEEGNYKTALTDMLKPFIYRRYIDYSAIQSLRKMKTMINAEVRRKGLKDNIKLGLGGIREVEFIAQIFQLVRGGRVLELQCTGTLQALAMIAKVGELSAERVQQLKDAYLFLRRVENILQQIADKQTQTLPDNKLDRCRIVRVMAFSNWDQFSKELQQKMHTVHSEFTELIGGDEQQIGQTAEPFAELFALRLTQKEMVSLLQEKGVNESVADEFSMALLTLKTEIVKKPLGPRGQETLEKLLPKIIEKISLYSQPALLIQRIQVLLLKIMRRTTYLDLLNENDGVLNQLLKLCNASPRVAEQLARYPILLDELLDPLHLYHPTKLNSYKQELQQFMLRTVEDDLELQMEALRQFKQMQFLHIAAADIAGGIELPQVSNHLTYLSEALVEYVVQVAWRQMVDKYGLPSNVLGTDRKGFAVIGYGKMGGFELGYGSDLDLVFLHDSAIQGTSEGPKVIENQLFYLRLAQRIIHLFSARTNAGILYEVDMRLRPSGDSGLLVASVAGYKYYLENSAWTWEHQALVRSRAVFSDPQIFDEFQKVREQVLRLPRQSQQLANDVSAMRVKMRKHLNRAKAGEFDLKHSPGGMVDIEFIAQYLLLVNASSSPRSLCKWSDNLRIFASCRELGLLTETQEKALCEAYCNIRDAAHRLTLNKQTRIVSDRLFTEERKAVLKIWHSLFD